MHQNAMTTAAMPTPLKIGQILNIPSPPTETNWPQEVSKMNNGTPQKRIVMMYGIGDENENVHIQHRT
jgi:hypothetical protein